MLLKIKKKIVTLFDTVSQMLDVLNTLKDPDSAVADCLAAIDSIFFQLEEEQIVPTKTLEKIIIVRGLLDEMLGKKILINEGNINLINNELSQLKDVFIEEIKGKLKVVFFPYKASMWDSLATVYKAAVEDEDCIPHVVPIPYYQLSQNGAIPTYEGARFPEDVPVVDYRSYNLEEQQPDIIFVHNIYDQYNTLTRVHEEYYSSNLKRYTGMLVYVPYYISSFTAPQEGHNLAYSLRTLENVNKIILVGDYLKEAACQYGVPEEKLLALGSPKLDGMVNALKKEVTYPAEWEERVKNKTVYLVNTGCLYFVEDTFLKLEKLVDFFNIPRIDEDSVVIWRPHPLTEISILKYIPHFATYYSKLTDKYRKGIGSFNNKVILDETEDYLPALNVADVLISAEGSLLNSYLLTEKKVMFLDSELRKDSLIPPNTFYFVFNQSEPWFELVKKFSKGYDPLAQNRKGMLAKVYNNIDGTSGEKVYHAIKNSVLENL